MAQAPLEFDNVIVRVNDAGVVTVQTVGSMDATFAGEQLTELAEWLDDVILAQVIAEEAQGGE